MNRRDLEKRVAQAQLKLQEVEVAALNAERIAKAAKARAQQLKLEHRQAKKSAKQAKRFAAAMAEKAKDQCRVLEKAERRLARALARIRPPNLSAFKKSMAAAARHLGPARSALSKAPHRRGGAASARARRSAGNGHPSLAGARLPKNSCAQ